MIVNTTVSLSRLHQRRYILLGLLYKMKMWIKKGRTSQKYLRNGLWKVKRGIPTPLKCVLINICIRQEAEQWVFTRAKTLTNRTSKLSWISLWNTCVTMFITSGLLTTSKRRTCSSSLTPRRIYQTTREWLLHGNSYVCKYTTKLRGNANFNTEESNNRNFHLSQKATCLLCYNGEHERWVTQIENMSFGWEIENSCQ